MMMNQGQFNAMMAELQAVNARLEHIIATWPPATNGVVHPVALEPVPIAAARSDADWAASHGGQIVVVAEPPMELTRSMHQILHVLETRNDLTVNEVAIEARMNLNTARSMLLKLLEYGRVTRKLRNAYAPLSSHNPWIWSVVDG